MRLTLLLSLGCLLLVLTGCPSSTKNAPSGANAQQHQAARELFGAHRDALPRMATTMPLPMDEKYWTYSATLAYPDAAACQAELATDLAEVPLGDMAHRATLLQTRLQQPAAGEVLAVVDAYLKALLDGSDPSKDLPPVQALAAYVAAYFSESETEALLRESLVYDSLATTIPIERTDIPYEDFVRAQLDFRRLQLANSLVRQSGLKSLMPAIRQYIGVEHSTAVRLEAARTLYALGDTDQRALLLFLGFGNADSIPLYGWPTYAFLAEARDAALYDTLRERALAATGAERGQYLVHLSRYGKAEDLSLVTDWIRTGLPRLPEQRIAPEGEPVINPTSWSPEGRITIELVQDGRVDPPTVDPSGGDDPHHDLLNPEEMSALFGYEVDDVNTAMRIRLLQYFDAEAVRPILHEALLKGGPAVRVAAGELLATLGNQDTQDLIPLVWKEESDSLVLAELAYTWLMIERRLSSPPQE